MNSMENMYFHARFLGSSQSDAEYCFIQVMTCQKRLAPSLYSSSAPGRRLSNPSRSYSDAPCTYLGVQTAVRCASTSTRHHDAPLSCVGDPFTDTGFEFFERRK